MAVLADFEGLAGGTDAATTLGLDFAAAMGVGEGVGFVLGAALLADLGAGALEDGCLPVLLPLSLPFTGAVVFVFAIVLCQCSDVRIPLFKLEFNSQNRT